LTGSSSSLSAKRPIRLPVSFKEKVWGAEDLFPWFPAAHGKIGEVWFEGDLPLLVKFVFTTEALSVQVHPDDAFAQAHEKSAGKTEMWYVLRAEEGARVAIGLRESTTPEQLRAAAQNGTIEGMLNWMEAKQGDAYFIPAGTIHAIGAGLAMCEIQQNSDITYRLYDYGRPRELHLEKAIQVASTAASKAGPTTLPVDCKYFHVELARITTTIDYPTPGKLFHLLVFAAGMGIIAGQPFREGETWLVPADAEPFSIRPQEPTKFLRAWSAESSINNAGLSPPN
jgi:mannose-6-phosphate isomerase